MADLSLVNDNYFTIASETFSDNLSGSIAAGAVVVPVNNASEYTNGDCVVLTVDPGTVNEATFIGKKNGSQFEECVWTEGNLAVGHSSGATIIDYDSATHHNAQTKGIKEFANDDGTLITQAVRDALNLSAAAVNGWEILPYTLSVTTGYNKGNKSFDITAANNDLTSTLSAGMRLRLQRGTTAPTQCMDLESGSSQYASKTSPSGISFTDDFTCEAWVKLESYTGAVQHIVGRKNASTEGFQLGIDVNGQVRLMGQRIAANYQYIESYQSVPLGEWVHIAAALDMSGSTGAIYINGSLVPSFNSTTGTAAALVQGTTALTIGAANAPNEYFDGRLSDVRIWNVVRTPTQVKDNMNQQLVGSETNLVGYWKLNGNLNDSTSNANNMTGSGGAVATTTDNPMKDTEYGIIQSVTYSAPNTTINVFTGTDHNIPNMTLSSPYYSTQKAPFGFPSNKNQWQLKCLSLSYALENPGGFSVFINMNKLRIDTPIGSWKFIINGSAQQSNTSSAAQDQVVGISTSASSADSIESLRHIYSSNAATGGMSVPVHIERTANLAAQTTYYAVGAAISGGGTVTIAFEVFNLSAATMVAENAYI